MSERVLNPDEQKLWEEARGYAVSEIIAKYRKEFLEAHSKHFKQLEKRALELENCTCTNMGNGLMLQSISCPIHGSPTA